ncbi:hypothetical protein HK096_000820 [Nowakowskiella sp. JEL0078]|nr:hypothetical protein HK096_000820 [Nowakowskiella sp. JEL0078]
MRGVENVNVIASKKSRGAQPIVNMNRSLGSSNASNSALIPAPYGSKPTSRSDSPTRSPLSPNMIQKGSLQRQTNQKNPNDTFIVQGYYPTAQSPLSRPLHPSSPLTNQNSGQIQRLNSAQKSVQSEFDLSDYGGGYTPTSIGESSVFERLRGVREERSKAAPQNPKNLYVPAPGTSIASTTPPHSPTSTEGGYIGPQAFGANTSASVIVVESERDVNDEVYTYDTSISHDSRRMTKSSVGFDAYSQRSSSLGFPIHSQRNRRLKTTGPASIFDVLSEAGVDIKSDIYSEKSASTGTIFQTVNLANAVNASDRNIVYNNVLGSPVSVQAASILSDVDGVKKSPLEIATVIWPYISDQDDEWGRGWSKKSKKTGFFPLAAVTTTVSELGDFLEKGSSLPRKSRVYSEYNDLDEEEMENRVFGSITEKSYLSRNISDISFTDIDKLKKKENATPLYNFDSVKAQLGEYDLTDLDDPPLPPPRRRTTGLSSRNGTNSFLTSDSSSAPSLFQAPSKNTEKPKSKMTEYGW